MCTMQCCHAEDKAYKEKPQARGDTITSIATAAQPLTPLLLYTLGVVWPRDWELYIAC
jgi:hypothetical protein